MQLVGHNLIDCMDRQMENHPKWYEKGAVQAAIVAGVFTVITGIVAGIFSLNNTHNKETIDSRTSTNQLEATKYSNESQLSTLIVGKWVEVRSAYKGIEYKIEIAPHPTGKGFQILNLSPESMTDEVGEMVGEFEIDSTGEHHYVGRHIWGGSKTNSTKWGAYGGLVIDFLNSETIRMIFLDSKYSDGWVFKSLKVKKKR